MRSFRIFLLATVLCAAVQAMGQTTPSATSSSERLTGVAKRAQLAEQSLFHNLPFRNIGPTVMSGRAVDLEVNPEDPNEFYVAYASGGLWYTNNNGQSFEPLFDQEDVITIGDFAVDWKTRNIWIGTGEVNSSRSSYSGVGMYFSADSGKTWQHKGLPESHHIGKVLLHPGYPNTLWVAALGHLYSPNAERGIFKTTDGGLNWKRVLFADDTTGAVDLVMDPTEPNTLYATLWHRDRRSWNFVESGAASGIYKSTDGGEQWVKISGGTSGFPEGPGVGRIGLAVSAQRANVLYAVLDNQDRSKEEEPRDTSRIDTRDLKDVSKAGFLALNDAKLDKFLRSNGFPEKYTAAVVKELIRTDSIRPAAVTDYLNDANNSLFDTPIIGLEIYRSEDAGKTWKKTHTTRLKNVVYTYGYYFGRISVSPFDDNRIAVCGLPLIFSTDGGKTFKPIDGDNVHGDHHAVWMSATRPGHMIICNDGGLNITYDEGKHWFKANTPPVGQFYHVAVDMATPYNVYGGLQDNGVWTGSSATTLSTEWHGSGSYPYRFLMGGDGMQTQVDYRDNATVYTGYQFGYYYKLNKNNPDGAQPIQPQNDLGAPNFRFNWQTPIWLSRHNQDILYFGSNRFHRSMNPSEPLKVLSEDLTRNDRKGDVPYNTITSIAESPLRFGLIYLGTDDGYCWVSKDAGYTWTRISDGLPPSLWVSRVEPSAHKEGRVYVTLNGYRFDHFLPYVYVSEDYGASWKPLANGLPHEPVNVIREDPANEQILYAGTDNGLYVSLDRGTRWMSLAPKLPRTAVHDMVVHPREPELVVGTHGRSIYIVPITDVRTLTDSVRTNAIAFLHAGAVNHRADWGKRPDEFSDPSVPSAVWAYYAKDSGIVKVRLLSKEGVLLREVADTAEAGLNYVKSDLSLDIAAAKKLEAEVKKARKDPAFRMIAGKDDGKYYAVAGEYEVRIADTKGNIAKGKFEVREKSSPKPAEVPDPESRGVPGK